jgi:hypothetical protein
MKRFTVAGLVSALLIAALCIGLVIVENSHPQLTAGHMWSSLRIGLKTMTEDSGFYNVYFTINASVPETINRIQLNKNVDGLTTYVNGSKVNPLNPPQIKLNGGDLIEVKLTMPIAEYSSISELKVHSTVATYGLNMPTSFQPYLATNMGWYMHNSSDPVSGMTNKFTIYGYIENRGVTDAHNCSLALGFYRGEELIQTSNVPLGEISGFFHIASLNSTNISCSDADSVTRTEVRLTADNVPNS